MTLPARVSEHAPQFSLSPSHYFLSDLIGNILPQSPRVLVESTSRFGSVSIFIEGNWSNFGPGFYFTDYFIGF
jgi:hypothetical protein